LAQFYFKSKAVFGCEKKVEGKKIKGKNVEGLKVSRK
jgi:hypothetical protein